MPEIITPERRFGHSMVKDWRCTSRHNLMITDWLDGKATVLDRKHLVSTARANSWCDIRGTRTFGFMEREKMENFRHAVEKVHGLTTKEITYA